MYIGPTGERWQPSSEGDLSDALVAGLLEETHYVELKESLGSTPAANKELARDLAQFGIDAGTLILGINERNAQLGLSPLEVAGLPERIEQIARSAVDPPLPVRCEVITTVDDPARGYVLIHIPASGQAPHMVDGVYYGRGDKTRHRLSNAEVTRLHATLRVREDEANQRLEALIARDPIPAGMRRQAHFFAFASPVTPRREMALKIVHGSESGSRFHAVIAAAHEFGPFRSQLFSPDLRLADRLSRRPDGAALSSYQLRPDRTVQDDGAPHGLENVIELEITEEGELRLFAGRLSDGLRGDGNAPAEQVIFDVMAVAYTRQILAMANHVGHETGYRGQWIVGVAATGIEGLQAYDERNNFFSRSEPQGYAVGSGAYRSVAVVTTEELEQVPGQLTKHLIGRLLRALGRPEQAHAALLTD